MKKNILIPILVVLFIVTSSYYLITKNKNNNIVNNNQMISGKIVNGLRIITQIEIEAGKLSLYRGDYVKIIVKGNTNKEFSIDTLKIKHSFPEDKSGKSYFKLKKTGKFKYKFSGKTGIIDILEYDQANYKAVSAQEGFEIIKNINPLILDVRTQKEYQAARLKNAVLLPVQVLQKEYKKIEKYKEKPVFIYCASGNRSTVASRILIRNGFRNIYNLRHGIKGWYSGGFKIER